MTLKQMEVVEKKIGENTFFIKKFPAFTAVNISGELGSVLAPIIGGVAAVAGKNGSGEVTAAKASDIMNTDIEDALPAFSQALSDLSGDKFEHLAKRLLIDHNNVSVEGEATDGEVKLLTYDLANEVFCGDVQDMFILCFEIVKLNFNGFFKKIGTRFGGLTESLKKAPTTASGATSTRAASRNSK